MEEDELKCLKLIEKIRSADKKYLSDPRNLERELLLELGLNDEFINEYPAKLHSHCGKGLRSWQYPNQFSKYLVHLSQYKIESYLEIGVRHGGTFIITVEYLNRFHPIKKALAVDINRSPLITEYNRKWNKKADFWHINSQSFKFEGFCNHCDGTDLTLIDADHSKSTVYNDFNNVQKMSKMIALHDVSNDVCPAVGNLWKEQKKDINRYENYEFIDQYGEFRKQKKHFFGMGLLVSKGFDGQR